MSKHSTEQRRHDCPSWCDDAHHIEIDLDHYSDGVAVPVVWQLSPELDPPAINVYLVQEEPGYAPMLAIGAAVSSRLLPTQAHDLIVAIADQLGRLDMGAFYARRAPCPGWCTIPDERHVREADDWKGGAVHWSPRLDGDGDKNDVSVAVATNANGSMQSGHPIIHMHQTELTANQARTLALDLLHAAAWADIAEASDD